MAEVYLLNPSPYLCSCDCDGLGALFHCQKASGELGCRLQLSRGLSTDKFDYVEFVFSGIKMNDRDSSCPASIGLAYSPSPKNDSESVPRGETNQIGLKDYEIGFSVTTTEFVSEGKSLDLRGNSLQKLENKSEQSLIHIGIGFNLRKDRIFFTYNGLLVKTLQDIYLPTKNEQQSSLYPCVVLSGQVPRCRVRTLEHGKSSMLFNVDGFIQWNKNRLESLVINSVRKDLSIPAPFVEYLKARGYRKTLLGLCCGEDADEVNPSMVGFRSAVCAGDFTDAESCLHMLLFPLESATFKKSIYDLLNALKLAYLIHNGDDLSALKYLKSVEMADSFRREPCVLRLISLIGKPAAQRRVHSAFMTREREFTKEESLRKVLSAGVDTILSQISEQKENNDTNLNKQGKPNTIEARKRLMGSTK